MNNRIVRATLSLLFHSLALALVFASGEHCRAQTTIIPTVPGGGTLPGGWVGNNNVAANPIDQGTYYLVEAGATPDTITTGDYNLSAYSYVVLNVNVATFGSGTAYPLRIQVSTASGVFTALATSYTTATPSSSTYITGGPVVIPAPSGGFTATTKLRFTHPASSGRGVRIQNISLVAPTQASALAFSGVSSSSITVNWTDGSNGSSGRRAAFMAAASSGTAAPVNGTTYTANTTFGSGTQIGSSGWYCIYNGTGAHASGVTVGAGLTAGTTYRIMVCEYEGSGSTSVYNISTATDNPNNQTTDSLSGDLGTASIGGESLTISSLLNDATINSPSEGVQVWQVAFENPSGGSGDGTITALTLAKGGADGTGNWASVIQAAELFDGNSALASGTVSSSSIAFSGLSILVADGFSKNLSLRLSLKSTAGALTDNAKFQFVLTSGNVTVSGNAVTTASINSDAMKNVISVVATRLAFSSGPPSSVGVNAAFSATLQAQDVHGNLDTDSTEAVNVSLASGTGSLSNGGAQPLAGGTAVYSSLTYNKAEVFTIQGTASGLAAAASASITASLANATTILFSTSSSGSAWRSTANWTGGAIPTATQVAQFGVNPTGAGVVGINLNFTGNNQVVGGIEVTSARTLPLLIGNSSGTADGTLTISGVVVNGVENVILRNNSSQSFTLQAAQSGVMDIALGNATDNKVSLDGSGSITVSSKITGSGKRLTVTGSGSGSLTLSGGNTYSGDTTVSGGTLKLSGSGSIANSPVLSVASGATLDVSAVTGGYRLTSTQTLKGNGTVSGSSTIAGTIAPGASVGTLNTGNETWAGGGTYDVEMDDAAGTAGVSPGWDKLAITGTLTISATPASQFIIKLSSLGSPAAHFDNSKHRVWRIVTTTGGISGFNSTAFVYDYSAFEAMNDIANGQFTVGVRGNDLYLAFWPDCSSPATTKSHALDNSDPLHVKMTATYENLGGLVKTDAKVADNCTIVGTAYDVDGAILASGLPVTTSSYTDLPIGTTKVFLVATKNTESSQAVVNPEVRDFCGTWTYFDPILTTVEVLAGNVVQQRFEGLLAAEHYLMVANGTPGLERLDVNINGRVFTAPLTAGQRVSADLRSAMREGTDNVVLLTGYGPVGASAFVTLTDTPTGEETGLAELVMLTLAAQGNALQLTWPESLSGWQLQSSATLAGDWSPVDLAPVAVNGQWTVTLPATGGAQFFRLEGPVGIARPAAAAALGVPVTFSSEASATPTPAPRYDALLW